MFWKSLCRFSFTPAEFQRSFKVFLIFFWSLCLKEFITLEDLDKDQIKRFNFATSVPLLKPPHKEMPERVKEGRVMLRNPRRSSYKQYTMASMWAALERIEQGLSVYRASLEFGVPRKTLRNWMKKYNIMSYFDLRKQHRLKRDDVD